MRSGSSPSGVYLRRVALRTLCIKLRVSSVRISACSAADPTLSAAWFSGTVSLLHLESIPGSPNPPISLSYFKAAMCPNFADGRQPTNVGISRNGEGKTVHLMCAPRRIQAQAHRDGKVGRSGYRGDHRRDGEACLGVHSQPGLNPVISQTSNSYRAGGRRGLRRGALT